MGAPELIVPGTAAGGPPVGGSGTAGTLPIWIGPTTLDNSAVTQVAGSIFSLTGLVGGTGYAAPSPSVALGGGTGAGATASYLVSGGSIQWVNLLDPGTGYTPGDVLTIPGGVGGTITVLAVVPKNVASGHLTAQRIGAGTTEPNAGIDSRFGGFITGWQRVNVRYTSDNSTTFVTQPAALRVGGVNDVTIASASQIYGVLGIVSWESAAASSKGAVGALFAAAVANTGAGNSSGVTGCFAQAFRTSPTDLSTSAVLNGFSSQIGHGNGGAATYTTATMRNYVANALANQTLVTSTVPSWIQYYASATPGTSPYILTDFECFGSINASFSAPTTVVTNYYGVRLRAPTATGGAVITNRYPHAQEDTDGRNYFRSPTFFGSAVGTARSATNPSVEVEAVGGISNGDVRLRSAAAVFDASNSSTNGVRFFARTAGTDLPATTTQSWYEEGTYTPAGNVNFTLGTCTGTWTRIGRKVFVTLNFAAGVNNGSTAAGASSLGLPNGLAPARSGLGLRAQVTGAASGNGLVAVNAATGLIEISTTVALDTNAKVIQCEYEV